MFLRPYGVRSGCCSIGVTMGTELLEGNGLTLTEGEFFWGDKSDLSEEDA